jgi:ABC-type amino acid transport substrate-binding protein
MILFPAVALVSCSSKPEIRSADESMQRNKVVRIATAAVNPPFELGEGTGVKGLDVDIGEEICRDLGYPSKWIKLDHSQLLEVLKNGGVEFVISAFGITPERRKEVAFSESYFTSDTSIAHRRDHPEIKDLASLSGKRVGVQALTVAEQFMESQKTARVTLSKFPTLDDGLGALNRAEIDAVVGDEYVMTYSISHSFANLITTGVRLKEKPMGVAVRKEEKKLLATINGTLARLKKSGELDSLRQKWFNDLMEQAREDREKLERELALKKAPKAVTINIIKAPDVNLNMDRLDGFQAEFVGSSARFTSEPILTSGNRGSCRFPVPIPPGTYRLNISIFKMSVEIKIPEKSVSNVAFDLNIRKGRIDITEK